MRDQAHNLQVKRVLSPVSVGDDTAAVGEIIDRAGYESLTYAIAIGAVADADATFVVLLEESDDATFTTKNAVADADLIGTEVDAGFDYDADDEVRKLGYIGSKRYTRLTVTPSNNTGAALISAIAVLGHPHVAPVTQAAA